MTKPAKYYKKRVRLAGAVIGLAAGAAVVGATKFSKDAPKDESGKEG